jgi:hypothetical protein
MRHVVGGRGRGSAPDTMPCHASIVSECNKRIATTFLPHNAARFFVISSHCSKLLTPKIYYIHSTIKILQKLIIFFLQFITSNSRIRINNDYSISTLPKKFRIYKLQHRFTKKFAYLHKQMQSFRYYGYQIWYNINSCVIQTTDE